MSSILDLISFQNKYFRTTLLFIYLLESLSFLGFIYPVVNTFVFFLFLVVAILLTLEKLEYGIYILFAELFIGSKGYLFWFESDGVRVSIRLALFLVVTGIGLLRFLQTCSKNSTLQDFWSEFKNSIIKFVYDYKFYCLFLVFIVVGVINGIVNQNEFSNTFFDVNGYFYWFILPLVVYAFKNQAQLEKLYAIFFASVLFLSLKGLVMLFIFSHDFRELIPMLYRWLRLNLLGEITILPSGISRVFMQSQIYIVMAFFILVTSIRFRKIFTNSAQDNKGGHNNLTITPKLLFLIILAMSNIIISFSRSFWAGTVLTLMISIAFIFYHTIHANNIASSATRLRWRMAFKETGTFICVLIAILYISLSLITSIVNFPYFKPSTSFSADDLVGRVTDTKESAVSSRWSLLPVLSNKILEKPFLGAGFGTTVTFKSFDPRVLAVSPSGDYTSYAFEWGYLDIILKIGLIGLVVYMLFIFSIIKSLQHKNIIGFLFAFFALLIINIFTPYLNHPLGIGYLLILMISANLAENGKVKYF